MDFLCPSHATAAWIIVSYVVVVNTFKVPRQSMTSQQNEIKIGHWAETARNVKIYTAVHFLILDKNRKLPPNPKF